MSSFADRIVHAAKLEARLYEEVEHDPTALRQAMAVVVLSSVAAGIGTMGRAGMGGILLGILAALAAWYLWAFLTYYIGTRLLPEPQTRADHGELLRTIGFASSPGLIRVLGIIPGLGGLVLVIAPFWMLAAMVVAVRQALDYTSTLRALAVCAIGWVIQFLILALLATTCGVVSAG